MIGEFRGPYRWLSNFYVCHVELDGCDYVTAEHAYQASKAICEEDRLRVARCLTPGGAKRTARLIPVRPDWDQVKLGVMKRVLVAKFSFNPDLRRKLLATGNQQLVEGNTWGDRFWGVCRGVGENHLGRLLMEVRDELR